MYKELKILSKDYTSACLQFAKIRPRENDEVFDEDVQHNAAECLFMKNQLELPSHLTRITP